MDRIPPPPAASAANTPRVDVLEATQGDVKFTAIARPDGSKTVVIHAPPAPDMRLEAPATVQVYPRPNPQPSGPPDAGIGMRGPPVEIQFMIPRLYPHASHQLIAHNPSIAAAMATAQTAQTEGKTSVEVTLPLFLEQGEVPLAPRAPANTTTPQKAPMPTAQKEVTGVTFRITPEAKPVTVATLPSATTPEAQSKLAEAQKLVTALTAPLEQGVLRTADQPLARALSQLQPPLTLPVVQALREQTVVQLNQTGAAFFAKPNAPNEASFSRAMFVGGLLAGKPSDAMYSQLKALFGGTFRFDLPHLMQFAQSKGVTPELAALLQQLQLARPENLAKRERRPEEMLLSAGADSKVEGKKRASAQHKRIDKLDGRKKGDRGDQEERQAPFDEQDEEPTA